MPHCISLQRQELLLLCYTNLHCRFVACWLVLVGKKVCSSEYNLRYTGYSNTAWNTGLLRRQRSKKWDNVVRQYWTRDKAAAAVLSRHQGETCAGQRYSKIYLHSVFVDTRYRLSVDVFMACALCSVHWGCFSLSQIKCDEAAMIWTKPIPILKYFDAKI